ncbi:ATP-binding protein [Luteimonas deserti]|uniref:histidine kinase n=1 Tax=Luteimonas deserti TaxID=2752306 RepID=A0A7Z0QRF6_9GAMM|nr:ATP-binding protein [Luteimonas deserti]NYZ62400.1 histidine kinase [Luteimonas deserti]
MPSVMTRWLDVPRIQDPVDRRNAPMLQVVLGLLASIPPLLWAYRVFGSGLAWRPGETASLVTSLVISAIALWSLVLIRRGRFQWAIRQMLVVVAAMMLVSYAMAGLMSHTFEQPIQVMWLFVAGMMVGRRALWAMFAVLVAAMVLGGHSDATRTGEPLSEAMADVGVRTVMFLLITIVVDRTSSALRNSLSEATRQAVTLADTNRRLSDEIVARERAQAQLLHAQKVEAVGRMASGVAHDFNHLLTLMLGYVERGRRSRDISEIDAVLGGLEMAVRRATAITHKLLAFARNDARQLERFDAVDALREIVPMLRQTLGPRIPLELDLPDTAVPIMFDRAQFALAVLNLTANAAQAMPEGGRFSLVLGSPDADGHVRLDAVDTGHGIPDELQAQIFEPFFTTRPPGEGTGLGLAVVAGLMADAGGSLTVDSAPGQGARFSMRLPVVPAPEPERAAA